MIRVALVAWLVGALLGVTPAAAQNVATMRLQQLAQSKVQGASPATQPFGGLLNQKQSSSQALQLNGGRCFVFIGTGGDGIKDVDLYIYDAQNKKVASDLGFDAVPALSYCANWPGKFRFEIVVKSGSGEVAAQVYVRPGPGASAPAPLPPPTNTSPDALTSTIEQTANVAAQGAVRIGDFGRGAGKEGATGDMTLSLEAEHCYTFFGTSSPTVRQLSLYLWDPAGKKVTKEDPFNVPSPVMRYCAQTSGPFHLQAKLIFGQGEFRLAAYAHPPQPMQAVAGPAAGSSDPIAAQVESQATQVAPGYQKQGDMFRGAGGKMTHTDWTVPLEGGRCYTFIGVGGVGVERLSLYAWDPSGKRVADRRSDNSQSVMGFCPTQPGPYHLQEKIEAGSGDYRMGVYVK
jgi:hypothetical protein